MSSNYPPGVTGNEPQIAGPRSEEVMHRACDNTSAVFFSSFVVNQLVEDFARLAENPSHVTDLDKWKAYWADMLDAHSGEVACDWEGDAEVAVWGDGTASWTCPRCGEEHEFDLGAERDEAIREEREERQRDMRYDDGL